jgi:hypothetical protein
MTTKTSARTSARLKSTVALIAIAAQLAAQIGPAAAFCGFYVAQADAKLFNKSSKVVLARDGDKTVITMASDYEGEPNQFALVIPVPTFIERKQIGVVDMATVDHLDAYTAPRLVEYFDPDPCPSYPQVVSGLAYMMASPAAAPPPMGVRRGAYTGVTVEATYDVAEYDVSILSARESDGLVRWLTDNGYKIPQGAEPVLASYIKQNMRFFVAKVNLERMKLGGAKFLRPLQVHYETTKFMLPLRLGTVNANGPQDLIVYALTRGGRVETTNYRTVKLPTGMDVPLYVKAEFGAFYKAVFDKAVADADMRAVFTEYAWDMGSCDPCSSPPMSNRELVTLGLGSDDAGRIAAVPGANAFVTRLHVRYDAAHFPEDLALMETHDRGSFQGRYVLRHPWTGSGSCARAESYRAGLPKRFQTEAKNLYELTGWKLADIEERMAKTGQPVQPEPVQSK